MKKNTLVVDTYASYIYLTDDFKKPLRTKDVGNGVYLDYDANDVLVGIEILQKIKLEDSDDK